MKRKTLSVIALFISFSIYFSCVDDGVYVPGESHKVPETDLMVYAKQLVGENGVGNMSFDEYILSICNSIDLIFPVERYQNEIAAYQAEIGRFPVVSNEYNEERQYMLWRNQQALLCSIKNYKN